MKRILPFTAIIAVLAIGIGVGYLLFASKPSTAVVMSQSVPAKAKIVTPVTKNKTQPAGDLYVTGGIEEVGFAEIYVPQPEDINSGGHVAAGNQNNNNDNTTQPESPQ